MVYKIAVIGIDGAWKAVSVNEAVEKLAQEFNVCKVGRQFHYHSGDTKEFPYERIDDLMEKMIIRSDHVQPKRLWVPAVQVVFILLQRFVEPYMERKYEPDLIINSRCMLIDPTVYASFYAPKFNNLPIDRRLEIMQKISGAELRDLYFYFNVSIDVALQRMNELIAMQQRSHPHETRKIMARLQQGFEEIVYWVSTHSDSEFIIVDSSHKEPDELSDIIVEETKRFIKHSAHSPSALS